MTRIPSRTNHTRGKVQHFHVQTLWLHILYRLAFHIMVTWTYEDFFSFVTGALSKGSVLSRGKNL